MPHRKSKNSPEIPWPDLEESYIDEFGPIDRGVYELAPKLWPMAASLIHRTIQDLPTGQQLMIKAIALVSHKLGAQPEKMTNLPGYLFQTFKHLVSEELQKGVKHGELNREKLLLTDASVQHSEEDLNRIVLVHEVLQRAEPWTREVFELRIMGHTFEEIGLKYHMESNYVRSRWSKEMSRLSEKIRAETEAAARRRSQTLENLKPGP